ncbi:MAG: tetratricopeptide repeat protein [Deltaproteobacteria bacterium]|nr:tetratricopeptide repeat protein [Deltaproteobacteria bacterium]
MVYRIMFFGGLLAILGVAYLVNINATETSVALTEGLKVDGSISFFLLVAVALGGFGSGIFFSLLALKRQFGDFFRHLKDKRRNAAQEALLEGIEAGFKGETKKVVSNLNKVLKLDKGNMEATLALVRFRLRERQPDKALTVLDAAIRQSPEDPRLHWYRIQALKGLDDPLRMTNQLLFMKSRYPRNRALMTMLVEQFGSRGYWREAVEVWQDISKGEAKGSVEKKRAIAGIANCAYELARRQWLAGNRDSAASSLKLAFDNDKEHVAAYLLKSEMEEKPSDALSVLKSGFWKKPSAIFLLEMEKLKTLDDPENSVTKIFKLYRKVLSRNPEYRPARWLYARFCLENQKFDEAEVAAKRLRESGFDGPLFEVLAGELACRKEHRLEVAVDHFKKALGCAERLEPVFVCGNCERLSPDWKYRCPHCGSYNSYDISERVCSFV